MYFQPPIVILTWSVIIPFMVVDTSTFIYSVCGAEVSSPLFI